MDASTSSVLLQALMPVIREVVDGADPKEGLLLNHGDPGLLRSLDRLSAAEASAVAPGDTVSVAAHVEHVRYGLELLNRWALGETPFADADWTAAWKRPRVTEAEWARARADLRSEVQRWQGKLPRLVGRGEAENVAAIAAVAHLAYHLGAIRQMHRALRGPSADASA